MVRSQADGYADVVKESRHLQEQSLAPAEAMLLPERIEHLYGERRNVMLAAMARYFPTEVRWTRPLGGLFLWVTLPPGVDSADLLKDALQEKVAFVPGASFYPAGGGERTLRLNFSYCTPEKIEEGMRRLGAVIKRKLAQA